MVFYFSGLINQQANFLNVLWYDNLGFQVFQEMNRKTSLLLVIVVLFALFIFGCFKQTKTTSTSQPGAEKKASSKSQAGKEEASFYEKLASHLNDPAFIYAAANNGTGHADIIKSSNDKKIKAISLKAIIFDVEVTPDGSELYASSYEDNKVLIIDLKTNKTTKILKLKDGPASIAFRPDGSRAYITHYASNYLSIIDTKQKKVVKTVKVGKHPAAIAISFDGSKAYVGHSLYMDTKNMKTTKIMGVEVPISMPSFSEGSKEIDVIDLDKNRVIATIPTRGFCNGLAVRPDDAVVYATLSSIDPAGLLAGKSQKGLKDSVAIIDTKKNKIVSEIKFDQGSGPKAVAFTPDMKKAYAICGARDDAIVINAQTHKIIKRIPLGLGG
jgi:YVTN family beta-propeller protein